MKKYYQPKGGKKGKYALRENTYRRIWYLIADYRYFKCVQTGLEEAEHWCSTGAAGAVTEKKNEYLSGEKQFERYIKAIEDAQKQIPERYVENIMDHIIEKKKYKEMEDVCERTMKTWLQKFIWHVAHNLGEV